MTAREFLSSIYGQTVVGPKIDDDDPFEEDKDPFFDEPNYAEAEED